MTGPQFLTLLLVVVAAETVCYQGLHMTFWPATIVCMSIAGVTGLLLGNQ